MKIKTDFPAVTIKKSIIPDKRKVILRNVGAGAFLVIMAETNSGKLRSTQPMSLFLRRDEFTPAV